MQTKPSLRNLFMALVVIRSGAAAVYVASLAGAKAAAAHGRHAELRGLVLPQQC
jgi:hypothetical protein